MAGGRWGARWGVGCAVCAVCAVCAACAVLTVWVVPRVAPVLTAERRHRGRVRWRARGGQDAAGDAARCRRAHARGLRGAGYATLGSNPRRAGSLPGEPCPARVCSSRGCASPWAGGEAVYIDTEGSFLAERVAEMAKALRPRTYPAPTPHLSRTLCTDTHGPQTLALTVTRALTTANRDSSPAPGQGSARAPGHARPPREAARAARRPRDPRHQQAARRRPRPPPDPTAAYTPVGLHNPDQGRGQVQ